MKCHTTSLQHRHKAWQLNIYDDKSHKPGFMLPSFYVTNMCFQPTDANAVVEPVPAKVHQ